MDQRDTIIGQSDIDPSRYVVKVNASSAIVGLIFFSLAAAITWWMFRPYAPPLAMEIWLTLTIVFLLAWLLADIVFVVRRPSDHELVTFWSKVALFIRITSNLVVLSTLWFFFPHAPSELQLVMTVFYVAHVPTQVLTLPSNAWVNASGAALVLGSLVIQLLRAGSDYGAFLAAFISAFLVAMILLAMVVSKLINTALSARQQSDIAAFKLEAAVTEVAAERDAKTRFIAAASHDLGQPMQAAALFFEQVVRAPDQPARATAAEGVRRAFASAEQLLSHMLNHLRLEADRVEPILARVALGPLIRRVVEQATPAARAVGMQIRLVDSGEVLMLDPALLERALSNLVYNAIQHSGAQRLLIGVLRAGTSIRIWIIDDGVGIGRADASHVFNDYFQGSDSRAAVRTGFGLGLASVRRIAALMGGAAGLESRWLTGSAFFLAFPDPRLPRRRGNAERQPRERRKDAI